MTNDLKYPYKDNSLQLIPNPCGKYPPAQLAPRLPPVVAGEWGYRGGVAVDCFPAKVLALGVILNQDNLTSIL